MNKKIGLMRRSSAPGKLGRLAAAQDIVLMRDSARPHFGQPVLGGHVGMGPPSGVGSIGVATATYVHTKPSIRINILTARFMVVSPCVWVPWERVPTRPSIIQGGCNYFGAVAAHAPASHPLGELDILHSARSNNILGHQDRVDLS